MSGLSGTYDIWTQAGGAGLWLRNGSQDFDPTLTYTEGVAMGNGWDTPEFWVLRLETIHAETPN